MSGISTDIVAAVRSAPSVPCPGGVGIGTWIKQALQDGKTFVVKAKRQQRRAPAGVTQADLGKRFGTAVDTALRQHYDKTTLLHECNASSEHIKAARRIRDYIENLGITVIQAQYRVALPHRKLVTHVDAIGVYKQLHHGRPHLVCLEFKTTQDTRDSIQGWYHTPAFDNPTLRNGFRNTRANLEQLQTAFGCLGIRHRLRDLDLDVHVSGLIVLHCHPNEVFHVDVKPSYINEALFTVSMPTAARMMTSTAMNFRDILRLPDSAHARKPLMGALSKTPFTHVMEHVKCHASFVVQSTKNEDAYAVVAIVYDPKGTYRQTKAYANLRKHMRRAVRDVQVRLKTSVPVKAYVLLTGKNPVRLATLRCG